MSAESEKKDKRKRQYFCVAYLPSETRACMHVQESAGTCEECGSDRMYPRNLYAVKAAMDHAFNAVMLNSDESTVASRIHETHEAVLEELKRLNDRMERLEKANLHSDAVELNGVN